jgi:flagellar biosynthesis/type III secretory pathway ATPase
VVGGASSVSVGREVGELLEQSLGEAGRRRSVVVVATSDAPPVERMRAPK